MKKLFLVLSVAVAFALMFSISCWAGETTIDRDVKTARINVAKKVVGFIAGWGSGFLFHEAGHIIVAKIENVDIEWSGITGRWTAYTDGAKLRNIALAGFGAQVLSTEVMLNVDAMPKDNAFILGWLTYNIFNAAYYVARDSLQGNGGYGDFETLRQTGMNTDLIKVGLLAHAALSAYRLYKNPAVMPYVQATKNEIILGLTWRW